MAAKLVHGDDEIMLITTGGVLIRTHVNEIREMGRATQGVRLINLGEDEKLAGLAKIVDKDDDAINADNDHDASGTDNSDEGSTSAPDD